MKVMLLSLNGIKAANLACAVSTGKLDIVIDSSNTVPTSAVFRAVDSGHYSILEHITMSWLIEDISRNCSHQLVRHRHNSYTQLSQRYSVVRDNDWYDNSLDYIPEYKSAMNNAMQVYNILLDKGIKPEDARSVLPSACYTSLVMTTNMRAFVEQCNERLCNKAQEEIRTLYKAMKLTLENDTTGKYFAKYMVPKCVRYGKCSELKSCKE